MQTLFILLMISLCYAISKYNGKIRYMLSTRELIGRNKFAAGWSMDQLFDDFESKEIISYELSGNTLCFIENPNLFFHGQFTYNGDTDIIDFGIMYPYLFYLTIDGIYKIEVANHFYLGSYKIYEISNHNFTYIDAFALSTGNILIMLKD